MKKLLFLILAVVVACSAAMAAPAKPGIHNVTMPDGSSLQVLLAGDEWHHSFVTLDGFTIQRADDGFFYYVTTNGISKTRVHNTGERSMDEKAFIEANRDQMTMPALYNAKMANGKLRSRTQGVSIKAAEVPTSGSPRIPIILVQYSDISMKHTKANFESHYNTQTWSVLKYFQDQSRNAFSPQFDIYGIFTLPNNRRYYGANNNSGDDQRVGQMVQDAISQAGNNINWAQYDNDGDGYADACIVVYAGPGEAAGAAAETIWPCQWYLSSAIGNYVTRNNTKIDKFAVFCELDGDSDSGSTLDGVGTFCHEFSHCLGLPDFYMTTSGSYFGMGDWSLLDRGCYNNDGNRPCGYTAYERNFMGWLNLSTPTEGETYTISTVQDGGQAFKITSNNANEYYIIENIQKTGWNQYARSSGLQVTHVNYNATRWDNNTVNNYSDQGMTIIPADNSLKMNYYSDYGYYLDEADEAGDLYPYNGNDKLTSNSTPAATLYNSSTNLNKPITNITKNSNNTVSFTYMGAPAQEEETGGTASDAYLNIAKYATIDDAGWNTSYVNNMYRYTEDQTNRVGWLTLSVYGAWSGYRYQSNAGPQKWIKSNITTTTSAATISGDATWQATDIYKGSSSYFTTASAKYLGNSTTSGNTARTVIFYVTNTTEVKLLGMNNDANMNNYPTTLTVYQCTKNADGSITDTNTQAGTARSTTRNSSFNLSVNGLDETKVYRVVASAARGKFYEIGFKTPLKTLPGVPINVEADPGSTTADITWTPGSDNEDWNLRYREYVEDAGSGSGESTLWDLTLDNYQTQIADFSIYDGDGDGDNWGLVYSNEEQTDVCFASWSYDPDTESDLTPDNWLFTPEVELGGTLKFKSALRLTGWPDKLGVYVLPTGDDSYYKLGDIVPDAVFPSFGEYEFDLSEFEGMGQIAFRHYESDGNVAILLDDIEVITAGASGGEWIYVYSEESPYTIEGLTPETTYEVQVQGVNDDGVSDWTASTIFTTLAGIGVPTIVSAEPTATTSEITWTSGENNVDWNLRYREYVESTTQTKLWDFPYPDGYEAQLDEGWGIYNAGEGEGWGLYYANSAHTNLCFSSASYDSNGSYTPDAWLFTPEITLGGTLRFKAWNLDPNYLDNLGVFICTNPDFTSLNEFVQLGSDFEPAISSTEDMDGAQTYEFDLSGYEGTGVIAFRHYNCTDMNCLFVGNVEVTYGGGEVQPEWIYVYSEESPYTITGLTPETTYEVQVQGLGDGGATSAWTPSTLFTTLGDEAKTLAWICQNGVITEGQNEYIIADKLIAVYADDVKGILWCKDMGNASIFSTSIIDGQVDFLKNDPLAQNGRDWDQSNWIALHFSTPTATNNIGQLVNGAVNRYIKPGTVKGKLIDDVNYALRMDLDQLELVTQADDPDINPDYIPNVYCPANFLPDNLNIHGGIENGDGGYTGNPQINTQNYFFMNPKIQEICEVTYAQWDARNGYFTVPTSSGFDGAFYIGTGYNVIQSQNFTNSLQDEHIYKFKAIVQRSDKDNYGPKNVTTPATGITLYPVDLNPATSEIITAINTVIVNGAVVGVEYVNSLGMTSDKPFHGVNIVVTRYSDGTTTSVKKVFK